MRKEDKKERPPWAAQDTPGQRRGNVTHKSYIRNAQKAIEEGGEEKMEGKMGTRNQGANIFERIVEKPDRKNRMLHAGRAKAHSARLTQLRTGKVGFNEFLYERRVPGVLEQALRMWPRRDERTTRPPILPTTGERQGRKN